MRPEKRDYVLSGIALARETLEEAKVLLETSHHRGAVNRIYYACFYAVSAMLFVDGHRSIKHTGVRALFSQHYVRNGPFPKETGKFYNALFENRMRGDYREQSVFSTHDVQSWFQQAQDFVGEIAKQIEKKLLEQKDGEQGNKHD